MNAQEQSRLDEVRMQSHRDPAQLEHEIDQQRRHIEQLVGALESKLSPSELFDRLMSFGKDNGRDFAGNLMDTVKANPVPALLTAAGMLWLYSGRDRDPSAHSSLGASGAGLGATGTTGYYAATGVDGGSDGAMHTAKEKLGAAKEKVVGAKDRVADTASSAAGSVRERAHQGSEWFQRMLEDNPLAVAAMAVGVGALLGSVLPETRKEHELMGSASDRLTDKLKDLAHTGSERLAEAGREVTRADGAASSAPSQAATGGRDTGGTAATPTAGLGRSETGGSGYTPSRPH